MSKTPIFTLLRAIESDETASELMRAINNLNIESVEDFRNYSIGDLRKEQISDEAANEVETYLSENHPDVELKPNLDDDVGVLLDQIEDKTQRSELQRFFEFNGFRIIYDTTVSQRASYESKGLSSESIDSLEKVLKENYKTGFAKRIENDTVANEPVQEFVPPTEYEIIDNNDHLLVNDKIITISDKTRALKKDELLQIYQSHKEGRDVKEIAKGLNRSAPTVQKYLEKAELVAIKPRRTYSKRSKRKASGSPPIHLYESY